MHCISKVKKILKVAAKNNEKEVKSKWIAKDQCSVSTDGNKILNSGCKALSYQAVNALRPDL